MTPALPRLALLLAVLLTACALTPVASLAQGGGGGGGTPPPAVPADFPAAVPLPAGKVFGSSTLPGRWAVGITVNGGYADVVAQTEQLYRNSGFTPVGTGGNEQFANAGFLITFAAASHDHSPTKTDVTVIVQSL